MTDKTGQNRRHRTMTEQTTPELDAIVIGAGFAGLYQLMQL